MCSPKETFVSFWLMKTDEKDHLFFFTKLLKLTDGVQQFSVRLLYRSTSLSRALTASLWTDYCRGSVLFMRRLCFSTLKTMIKRNSPLVQVHRKIREDSDMAQDSLQCLAQLASMHGPVFPDENAQISYLAHLMEGLLSMINGWVTIIVTAVVFVYVLLLRYWSRILAQVWRNVSKVDTKLNSCYWETLMF